MLIAISVITSNQKISLSEFLDKSIEVCYKVTILFYFFKSFEGVISFRCLRNTNAVVCAYCGVPVLLHLCGVDFK